MPVLEQMLLTHGSYDGKHNIYAIQGGVRSTNVMSSEKKKNTLLVVGDKDEKVLRQLTEKGEAQPNKNATGNQCGAPLPCSISLDTRYYRATVSILAMISNEDATQWATRLDMGQNICALILVLRPCGKVEEERWLAETKQLLALLERHQGSRAWEDTSKAVVIESLRALSSPRDLEVYCRGEGIELLELSPEEDEAIFLQEEYHELWGIARLWELLESTQWPEIEKKSNPVNLPEQQIRLEKLIREEESGMQRGGGDIEDGWGEANDTRATSFRRFPTKDDEDAIMAIFDKPCHELPEAILPAEFASVTPDTTTTCLRQLQDLEEGVLGRNTGERSAEGPFAAANTLDGDKDRDATNKGSLVFGLRRDISAACSASTFDPVAINWDLMMEQCPNLHSQNHAVTIARDVPSIFKAVERCSVEKTNETPEKL